MCVCTHACADVCTHVIALLPLNRDLELWGGGNSSRDAFVFEIVATAPFVIIKATNMVETKNKKKIMLLIYRPIVLKALSGQFTI